MSYYFYIMSLDFVLSALPFKARLQISHIYLTVSIPSWSISSTQSLVIYDKNKTNVSRTWLISSEQSKRLNSKVIMKRDVDHCAMGR